MKITHVEPEEEMIDVYDMPLGKVGVTEDGHYYYRSDKAAICLDRVGLTYSGGTTSYLPKRVGCLVRLLPAGTEIKMICV